LAGGAGFVDATDDGVDRRVPDLLRVGLRGRARTSSALRRVLSEATRRADFHDRSGARQATRRSCAHM